MKNRQVKLPLVQALAWIVLSTICISGGGYSLLKFWLQKKNANALDIKNKITSIIQTGPQKEALKTVYLAELLDISIDRHVSALHFDVKEAEKRLLRSPVIKEAHVKIMKPGTIYIDYTVRQPLAWIYDFENTAIDEEGVFFPVHPFFTPKTLPEIYLGLPPFGLQSEDAERQTASWNVPRQDKYTKLALELLKLLSESPERKTFPVKRIDVSNAYAESYGIREIAVIVEDSFLLKEKGREALFVFPRLLRLSTKNYAQELGNYVKLREQLLEQERQQLKMPEGEIATVRMPEKIIDFRIPRLAFIDQNSP